MLKLDAKFNSRQEFDDSGIVFDIVGSELEDSSSVWLDSKIQDAKVEDAQSSESSSLKGGYRLVEEYLLKAAFLNLRKKISRRSLGDLSLRSLLWVFKGLIGKQVLKNLLDQESLNVTKPEGFSANGGQLKFGFELITVENKKEIIIEPQTFSDRILVIRKSKWAWLRNQSIRQVGRVPDFLFIILVWLNDFDSYFVNLDSKNLQANLGAIRKSFSEKNKVYFTEFIGWIEGSDVQSLNDSQIQQPPELSLANPSYWCYTSDPILKAIHEFRRKYSTLE